ncbi:hypothetical protein TWF506_001375 [Arthrobotrys conoides]|uniref:Uncharacterized protein n=1 Tax=Arthrobotrys conoides TaxID=74498 RepID=A0AAN8RY06_9PEZI
MCWYDLHHHIKCGHKFFSPQPSTRCKTAKRRSWDPEAEMPCISVKRQSRNRIVRLIERCTNCENTRWGLMILPVLAVPRDTKATPSTGETLDSQRRVSKKRKAGDEKPIADPSVRGNGTKRRKIQPVKKKELLKPQAEKKGDSTRRLQAKPIRRITGVQCEPPCIRTKCGERDSGIQVATER